MANKRINVSIDEGMLNMLDFLAKQSHLTRSQMVERMAWKEWKRRRQESEEAGNGYPTYSDTVSGEWRDKCGLYSPYEYMV